MMDVNFDLPVPDLFKNEGTTSVVFYNLTNPLDRLQQNNVLIQHQLVGTISGTILELIEGEVTRMKKLNVGAIKKIVMHTEYDPLVQYIVLLLDDNTVTVLQYQQLTVVCSWHDVTDVYSMDRDMSGRPKLFINKHSGQEDVSNQLLLNSCDDMEDGGGSNTVNAPDQVAATVNAPDQVAATALSHKLKSGFNHLQHLKCESINKENFIARKLSFLSSQLQDIYIELPNELVATLNLCNKPQGDPPDDGTIARQQQLPDNKKIIKKTLSPKGALKVSSTRHRVIHDRWIVCLSAFNDSDRIICDMDLILKVSGEDGRPKKDLQYTTVLLKSVQRKSRISEDDMTNHLTDNKNITVIEPLSPPLLKPKKKCFILGICDAKAVQQINNIIFSGLVTYRSKVIHPTTELSASIPISHLLQVSFSTPPINSINLDPFYVEFESEQRGCGVSLNAVVLVASSVTREVEIDTQYAPLNDFISVFEKKADLCKVDGLSNLYCCHTSNSRHILHLAAFLYRPISANKLLLTYYTRDASQACALNDFIKSLYSGHINITNIVKNKSFVDDNPHHLQSQFKDKLNAIIDYTEDGLSHFLEASRSNEQTNDPLSNSTNVQVANKSLKISYRNDKENLAIKHQYVKIDAYDYDIWRSDLDKMKNEIYKIYFKYSKC